MENNIIKSQDIDNSQQIRHYIVLVIENLHIIILFIVIALIFTYIKNRFAFTKYGVYTSVLVKKQEASPEVYAGGLYLYSQKNLENEIGYLKSYSTTEKVVMKNRDFFEVSYFEDRKFAYDPELYKNTPFIVIFDTTKPQYDYVQVHLKFIDTQNVIISIPDFDLEKKLNLKDTFEYKNFVCAFI